MIPTYNPQIGSAETREVSACILLNTPRNTKTYLDDTRVSEFLLLNVHGVCLFYIIIIKIIKLGVGAGGLISHYCEQTENKTLVD